MDRNNQIILYLGLVAVVLLLVFQTITDINKEKNENTTKEETADEVSSQNIKNDGSSQGVSDDKEWEEFFKARIEELRTSYPDGKYWNNMGIEEEEASGYTGCTETPCKHSGNGSKYCNTYIGKSNEVYPYAVAGRQSVGFASMLSDLVFGTEAEAYSFSDYEKVRPGDQARIDADTQTVFILEKTDEYIVVCEVNEDGQTCMISWGRKIMKSSLKGALYISRYEK